MPPLRPREWEPMNLRTAVAALAGAACTALTAGVLMASPAVAAPVSHQGGTPVVHAKSPKISPHDGPTANDLTLSSPQIAFGQENNEQLRVAVRNVGPPGGTPPRGTITVLEGATEVCHFTFTSVGGSCSPSDSQLPV